MDDDRSTDDTSSGSDSAGESDTATGGSDGGDSLATGADEGAEYTDLEDQLAVYEWFGMLAAGLGFFLTPVFTGPVAGYCAYRIRAWKPVTAMLIAALVLTTAVFWVLVVLFVIP